MHGPPGTGKTTKLSARTGATVAERGVDAVRIASFSQTAAREIASREGVRGVLPAHAVGTLHGHAYRAIGHPLVALDQKIITDWNDQVGVDWAITGDSRRGGLSSADKALGGGRGSEEAENGDQLITALDLLRARQAPGRQWPIRVQEFARKWTEWKLKNGVVDYSDMIIEAYKLAATGVPLEGAPSVLIVDEAQDMTPIECALTLAWGKLLGPDGRLVFAMDDDQAIMDFRGGDPAKILSADATDEVLSISHRVPSAVHAVAKTWIEQCSHRFPKDYQPRLATDQDPTPAHTRGWVYRAGYGLGSFPLIDAVERDLADGSTVMILATCGYMLTSTLRELRTRGVPFHNPYRPGDPLWNPLGKPARGMSTADRVLSYLIADERALGDKARLWTAADIQAWAELISFTDACMSRGADRAIKALSTGRVPFENVAALFRSDYDGTESLKKATEPDLKWFASVIAQSKQKSTSYPLRVAQSYGAVALLEPPRLVVGTLHSAKGAEASVVYLSPDLSPAGMHQWQGVPVFRDQIRRLFYVGLTRAYHRVVVLAPNSTNAVNPSELIPPSLEVRR